MEIISHNISTISSYIPIISNHIQLFGWLLKKIAMSILLSIPTKNRLRWLCLKSWSTLIYQGLSIQRLKRTPGSFKVPPKKNYIRPYIGLIYGRYLEFRFLKWPLTMDPVVLSEYCWGLVSRPPSRTSLQIHRTKTGPRLHRRLLWASLVSM